MCSRSPIFRPTSSKRTAPSPTAAPSAATQELETIERTHILSTLEAHGGNRTHAAAALRISVRTLQRKLKAWGLENYLHREPAIDSTSCCAARMSAGSLRQNAAAQRRLRSGTLPLRQKSAAAAVLPHCSRFPCK